MGAYASPRKKLTDDVKTGGAPEPGSAEVPAPAGAKPGPKGRGSSPKILPYPKSRKARSRPAIELTPIRMVAAGLGILVVFAWYQALSGRDPGVKPVDPVYTEASLRWAESILSRRIDAFIDAYHRAPDGLTEVGANPWSLISYERVDVNRYRLIAPGPSSSIVYDSMDSRQSFIGRSRDFLGHGPATSTP
jgi:hypothetical protein